MLRFALNLKYMSTSAYKAVRQSGIIHLPSERTLSDYTHWSNPHTGVQLEYIEKLSTMLEDVPCGQRHCALLMDEMKIKSGLVFNKHSGTLVGFVDLGGVNRDIDHIVNGNSKPEDSSKIPHKTNNPFRINKEVYFFCDVPHLLKTARNCFSNSFAHSCSRKMKVYSHKINFYRKMGKK